MSELEMNGPGSAGNVIAALCSFFVPGLGQLVQGRFLAAVLYFVGTWILWCCCLGWLPHVISIIDAAVWRRPTG
jgi:TM2 domain-containing membrane protein YozV